MSGGGKSTSPPKNELPSRRSRGETLEEADTSPGVRGIAASVRRFVWERDGGQCTFETADGRRCPAREEVEYHHDEPYGVGGDRSADNLRLMCSCHNAYMAELDYGKEKMEQYRRSADRVREPQPSFDYVWTESVAIVKEPLLEQR